MANHDQTSIDPSNDASKISPEEILARWYASAGLQFNGQPQKQPASAASSGTTPDSPVAQCAPEANAAPRTFPLPLPLDEQHFNAADGFLYWLSVPVTGAGETDPFLTFQTLDDVQLPDGKGGWVKRKDPGVVRVFNCRLSEFRNLWPQLVDLNRQGAGIYVTVQQTDGYGRRSKNITRIREVFIEDDGEGVESLPLPLRPSVTICSSPGRFHRHFFVADNWPTKWALVEYEAPKFDAVMKCMIKQHDSDPNAKDLARVLRVPGFYNLKRHPCEQPHLVHATEWNIVTGADGSQAVQRYTRDELIAAFPEPPEEKQERVVAVPHDAPEPTPLLIAIIKEMLACIPADSNEIWEKAGMALRWLVTCCGWDDDELYDIFDGWSRTGKGYHEANNRRRWLSFKRGENGETDGWTITFGTLWHLAKQHGYNIAAAKARLARERFPAEVVFANVVGAKPMKIGAAAAASTTAKNSSVRELVQNEAPKLGDRGSGAPALPAGCVPGVEERVRDRHNDYTEKANPPGADEIDVFNTEFAFLRANGEFYEFAPDRVMRKEHFRVLNAPRMVLVPGAKGQLMPKALADVWIASDKRRSHEGIAFEPGQPFITRDDKINRFRGFPIEPKEGPVEPFVRLVMQNCNNDPDQAQWLIQWMAHLVQKPWIKLRTSPFVFSKKEGVGKSLLVERFGDLLGVHYRVVTMKDLNSPHNAFLEGILLLNCDEAAHSDKMDLVEILKGLITNETILVNPKNLAQYTVKNYANLWFTSNKSDGVLIKENDRRYFAVHACEQPFPDADYQAFLDWWNGEGKHHVMHYLKTYDLTGFNPYAKAPETEFKRRVMVSNRTPYQSLLAAHAEDCHGRPLRPIEELAREMELTATAHSKTAQILARELITAGATSRRISVQGGRRVTLWCVADYGTWNAKTDQEWAEQHLLQQKQQKIKLPEIDPC